jgi:hypothetical protein
VILPKPAELNHPAGGRDAEAGKQITIPIDNKMSFTIATGAIRLASRYDAELM